MTDLEFRFYPLSVEGWRVVVAHRRDAWHECDLIGWQPHNDPGEAFYVTPIPSTGSGPVLAVLPPGATVDESELRRLAAERWAS